MPTFNTPVPEEAIVIAPEVIIVVTASIDPEEPTWNCEVDPTENSDPGVVSPPTFTFPDESIMNLSLVPSAVVEILNESLSESSIPIMKDEVPSTSSNLIYGSTSAPIAEIEIPVFVEDSRLSKSSGVVSPIPTFPSAMITILEVSVVELFGVVRKSNCDPYPASSNVSSATTRIAAVDEAANPVVPYPCPANSARISVATDAVGIASVPFALRPANTGFLPLYPDETTSTFCVAETTSISKSGLAVPIPRRPP